MRVSYRRLMDDGIARGISEPPLGINGMMWVSVPVCVCVGMAEMAAGAA